MHTGFKIFFRRSIFVLLFLYTGLFTYSQQAASVSTVVEGPFVESSISQIIYNSTVTVAGSIVGPKLALTIIGQNNDIEVRTQEFYVRDITVPGVYSAGNLSSLFDLNNLEITGIDPSDAYYNGLPAGRYQVCYQLYDTDYQAVTGGPPAGCFNILNEAIKITTNTVFTPPYNSAPELWPNQINATVMSNINLEALVGISITGDNDVNINTIEGMQTEFYTGKNIPYSLSSGDLDDLLSPENLSITGMQPSDLFEKGLPQGNYQLCIKIYDYNNEVISEPSPSGCSSFSIFNDTKINVVTQVRPLYSPLLEKYADQTMITLTSVNSQDVRLRITLTGDNGVVAKTPIDFEDFQLIELTANVPYIVKAYELSDYFDSENLIITGLDDVSQLEVLPEGNYQLCIQLLDSDYSPVSDGSPYGCSNHFTIRYTEPPQLINPICGQTLDFHKGVQNIVFNWARSPGASMSTEYTLKLVEIIDPDMDPNYAMLSATEPAFFETTVNNITSYFYGPADPILEEGRQYSWQVIAHDPNDETQFINEGRSPVCSFTYGQPDAFFAMDSSIYVADEKIVNIEPTLYNLPIPTNTITGRLNWAFPKSEEDKLVAHTAAEMVSLLEVSRNNQATLYDPNATVEQATNGEVISSYVTATDYTPTSNVSVQEAITTSGAFNNKNNVVLYGGGETLSIAAPAQNFVSETSTNINSSLYSAFTAMIGKNKYPLANVNVNFFANLKDGSSNNKMNRVQVGTATTDSEGNFEFTLINYSEDDGLSYRKDGKTYPITELFIEVVSPYFNYYSRPYPVEKKEDFYSMGLITGLAKSLRFTPKVYNNNNQELNDYHIKIYRYSSWYEQHPSLVYEGDHEVSLAESATEDTDNAVLYQAAQYNTTSLPSYYNNYISLGEKELVLEGGPGVFRKLFHSQMTTSDRYIIEISAEGFTTKTTSLSFASMGSDVVLPVVPEITKKYVMNSVPPSVEGQLLRKDTDIPVPNAEIVVKPLNGEGEYFHGRSDEEGYFKIPAAAKENTYQIVVSKPGIKTFTDSEQFFLSSGTPVLRYPLYVDVELVTVTGKVFDKNGVPINAAELSWESGGEPFFTDNQGRYISSNIVGEDALLVKKPGYKQERVPVNISLSDLKDDKNNSQSSLYSNDFSGIELASYETWQNNLMTTEWYGAKEVNNEQLNNVVSTTFSPMVLGYSAEQNQVNLATIPSNATLANLQINESLINVYNALNLEQSGSSAEVVNLPEITLSKFYLKVTVTDNENLEAIEDATVAFNDNASSKSTDVNGVVVLSDVPTGNVKVSIKGPSGSAYIPFTTDQTILANKDTLTMKVSLEKGASVSGTITAAGVPIEGAKVYVVSREDDIFALSAEDGSYSLPGIPEGEYTLEATKQGLVADSKTKDFQKQDYTIDFTLVDPGFDASKLLGFDIVLTDYKEEGDGFVITGSFINIPSNDLFTVDKDTKLNFTNIAVTVQDNILIPNGDKVTTDASELSLKIWSYLNMTVKSEAGIEVVKRNGPETGVIGGKLSADLKSTFDKITGIKSQLKSYPIKNPTDQNNDEFKLITNDGSMPFADNLDLTFELPENDWKLHGFGIAVKDNKIHIKSDGIHLGASLTMQEVPVLKQASITLNDFWINTSGEIQNIDVQMQPKPSLKLLSWDMLLSAVNINQYGLKIGGSVDIPIAKSPIAKFTFSNLSISPLEGLSQITGGTFDVDVNGLDVFNIVKVKSLDGVHFSLSKEPGTTGYVLTGSGKLKLPELIGTQITMRKVSLSTTGKFTATAETDFEVSLKSLATLKVQAITFDSNRPSVDVDADFTLDIPYVKAAAGGLHFLQQGYNVDKLALGLDIGSAATASVDLAFFDNGFRGDGKLAITSTPLKMDIGFEYRKMNNGIKIAADFKAGVVIPVTPVTTITKVGGGFSYNSSNNKYSITVSGAVAVAPGTEGALALDPLEVTIASGPVITGHADLKIMGWGLSRADLTIDMPKKYFDLEATIKGGFDDVVGDIGLQANAAVRVVVSGARNDSYWFVGGYFNMKVIKIINANANFLLAWDLNPSAHPEYHEYTSFIPNRYLSNGRVYGMHFSAYSFIGLRKADAVCGGFAGIAEGCIWLFNETSGEFHANLKSSAFGVHFASAWGGGASLDIMGKSVAGAQIGASMELNGSYRPADGWYFNGNVNAELIAWLGNCSKSCVNKVCWGGCFNACYWGCRVCPIPVGGKICVHPGLGVQYRSKTNYLKVKIDI